MARPRRSLFVITVLVCVLLILQTYRRISMSDGRGDEEFTIVQSNEGFLKGDASELVPPFMYENLILMPWKEGLVYSSHYCINTFSMAGQCVLRNVGVKEDGSIVYHRSPKEPQDDLRELMRLTMLKIASEEPIRTNTYSDRLVDRPATISFPSCTLGKQPGHDFDDIWTVFNGMTTVGMLGMDNVLFIVGCESISKFWTTLFPEVVVLNGNSSSSNGTLVGTLHVASPKTFWLSFPSLESGFVAQYFRDRSLVTHGVRVERSGMLRIAVRKKHSRHAIHNAEAVANHLKKRYPEAHVVLYRPETTSAKEEIEFISSLDVYITPVGGGSFSSQFLPDRATAIYTDACWPGTKPHREDTIGFTEHNGSSAATHIYCLSLDSFCWDQMPHYFKQYIGAKDVDHIVYDGRNKDPSTRNRHSTLSYSNILDLDELDMLMEEAVAKKNMMDAVGMQEFSRKDLPSLDVKDVDSSYMDKERRRRLVASTKRWTFENLDLWKEVRIRERESKRRRLRSENESIPSSPTRSKPPTVQQESSNARSSSRRTSPDSKSKNKTERPSLTKPQLSTKENSKTTSAPSAPPTTKPTTRAPLAPPLRQIKRAKQPHLVDQGRWSWHSCQNGDRLQYQHKHEERYAMNWDVRQCLLADVEITPQGEILYRLDPERDHPIRLGSLQLDELLVAKRKHFHGVEIRTVTEPFIADAHKELVTIAPDTCVVVTGRSRLDSTIRSLDDLIDDLFITFGSMANAGLLSLKNTIVVTKPSSLADPTWFESKYWGIIGEPFDVQPSNGNKRVGCLLLTPKQLPVKHLGPTGSGLLMKLMRDRAWMKWGIHEGSRRRRTSEKITIGWHLPSNVTSYQLLRDRTQTRLAALFANESTEVIPMTIIDTNHLPEKITNDDSSLTEELKTIASLDVMVSLCDSGYAQSLFLRDGATAVYLGFLRHNARLDTCAKLDAAPHFFKTYLGVDVLQYKAVMDTKKADTVADMVAQAIKQGIDRVRERDSYHQ